VSLYTSNMAAKPITSHVPEYNASAMHADLEAEKMIGVYGGAYSVFHAIAESKLGDVDLLKVHKKKHADEYSPPSVTEYLATPQARARWNEIVTFDPWGMDATRPTIAATTATMYLPELKHLEPFPDLITEDVGDKITNMAIDYVFNMPGLAARMNLSPSLLRSEFYKYTQNERMMDEQYKCFLPPLGGTTVYVVGDLRRLSDPKTEVAVRVHDECNGSDVFCTDICTCRPYLIFAIEGAIECAKRGGVGIIVYYRKEGRALGEVTKFRVYNARKFQAGGDRPETYFQQTESVAGIRDARFQEMMPDVLIWLGIRRIDWYFSMSSDKYDAITGLGIQVMQRVALPDSWVPQGASVEITAKIFAGYHSEAVQDLAVRLRQPESIREQCGKIFELAKADKCHHFSLDMSKLPAVSKYVLDVIKTNYPTLDIPHHSRLRHLAAGGIDRVGALRAKWSCDAKEATRRILDLVTISVLTDAGAGATWQYTDDDGRSWNRSEGLAVASFDMFDSGAFSSDPCQPHRVNSFALKSMSVKTLTHGFQVNSHNQMTGSEGRATLLQRLGLALESRKDVFGAEVQRPGNMLDYLLSKSVNGHVSVRELWELIVNGLSSIWPATLSGVRRGDIWSYSPLRSPKEPGSDMIPFHKLSQWLMLSLMETMSDFLVFDDLHLLTGLAEYRNGGLLIDLGLLVPKDPRITEMQFDAGSELVVEWRALTVCLLDLLAVEIRTSLNMTAEQLPLSKILEGGTWAAGRKIAKELRPASGSPPITIRSDGTVF